MFGLKEKYEQAWKMLIQPERMKYQESNLGPRIRVYDDLNCYRKDFTFKNPWDCIVQVSLFIPYDPEKVENDPQVLDKLKLNRACCIYLHSQSGNKIEGLSLLDFCIESGIGLCVFDFSGCGKSEGQYSTLGWREQNDLEILVNIVLTRYKATKIVLWGRSMGAVTALFYAKRHSMYVNSMVLDSPFSDIKVMVQDVVSTNYRIPGALISPILSMLAGTIKKKVDFNILSLKPIKFAETCSVPCMFIIGKNDKLVLPKRVQEIFKAYKGRVKQIVTSEGDHASSREEDVIEQGYSFITKQLNTQYPVRETFTPDARWVHQANKERFSHFASDFERRVNRSLGKGIDFRNLESRPQPEIEFSPGVFDEKFDQESKFVMRAQANSLIPSQKREERGMYDDYDQGDWNVSHEKVSENQQKQNMQSGSEWSNMYYNENS